MSTDQKITSIFAATRYGQAALAPSVKALRRIGALPAEFDYPATHHVLERNFNFHFDHKIDDRTVREIADDFRRFCQHEDRELRATAKHYRLSGLGGYCPDPAMTCGLNFQAVADLSDREVNRPYDTLRAARDDARQVQYVWECGNTVSQAAFDRLEPVRQFIFMDLFAKRLELFLKPRDEANIYDEPTTMDMLRLIDKAAGLDFGTTVLARKIRGGLDRLEKDRWPVIRKVSIRPVEKTGKPYHMSLDAG